MRRVGDMLKKLCIILDLDTTKIFKNIPDTITNILKFVNESYLCRLNFIDERKNNHHQVEQ